MSKDIRLDVAELERAIANLLVTYPELAEDDELRADTFEGETDFHKVLAALVDREREAKAMAGAVKARMDDLATRKARYERQQEAMRSLMGHLMDRAGQRKVTLPEATISVSFRKPAPFVADEAALPDECCKVVRKPDMATIKDWCEAGNIPDGVAMSNGKDVLTVRAK
jgi:hypothetical protein